MNIIKLYYKRPKKMEENAEWQEKTYGQLSYALDGALRFALGGYAVWVECNGRTVLIWAEGEIEEIYKV